MRLTLLKLTWLLAGLIAGGCMSPLTADEKEPGEDNVVIDRDEQLSDAGNAISFSMNDEQFASLATWLGKSNSVVFEKPFHVEADGTTIDAKAGTTFVYVLGDGSGTITFAKPFPTVKAGIAKLIGGVSLHSVDLKSDGTGTAATALGRYKIRWAAEDEAGGSAAAKDELPEVWAYSMANCTPCENAKTEIAAATDLKFKVVWHDSEPPAYLNLRSRPAFWWGSDTITPDKSKAGKTLEGWSGLKHLKEQWQKNRVDPKKFSRSFQSGQASSVARPDRDVGSRSVAIWSINGDFTPSRSVLLSHLSRDGIHRGRHDPNWLATLTVEQLRWVHDRDHGS